MNCIDKIAWLSLHESRILSTRSRGRNVFYLPGGKREAGESDLETLEREVREELSVAIDPTLARLYGTFEAQADGHAEGVRIRMTCYFAPMAGQLRPAAEIEELAWFAHEDRVRSSPVDRIVFDRLHHEGLLRAASMF